MAGTLRSCPASRRKSRCARQRRSHRSHARNGKGPAMITARSLTRTFDRTAALRDVSITIDTGEMFALIGPDGAGKTTFFRIVAGLLRPTSGEIHNASLARFGFVPQK